jgi:hypothetical protein
MTSWSGSQNEDTPNKLFSRKDIQVMSIVILLFCSDEFILLYCSTNRNYTLHQKAISSFCIFFYLLAYVHTPQCKGNLIKHQLNKYKIKTINSTNLYYLFF